jgi:hypothetical protein
MGIISDELPAAMFLGTEMSWNQVGARKAPTIHTYNHKYIGKAELKSACRTWKYPLEHPHLVQVAEDAAST